jgi:hypothetical protein
MDKSLLKYVLWSSWRCVFKQFTCCDRNMYLSSEHLGNPIHFILHINIFY